MTVFCYLFFVVVWLLSNYLLSHSGLPEERDYEPRFQNGLNIRICWFAWVFTFNQDLKLLLKSKLLQVADPAKFYKIEYFAWIGFWRP